MFREIVLWKSYTLHWSFRLVCRNNFSSLSSLPPLASSCFYLCNNKKNPHMDSRSHFCHLLRPPWLPPVVHHSHVIPPPGDLGGGRLSCWQCGAGVFISGGVLRCTMAALSLCQCQGCFAWLALSPYSRPAFVWAACQKFVTWPSSLKRHAGGGGSSSSEW